jgi:hypothetical protein
LLTNPLSFGRGFFIKSMNYLETYQKEVQTQANTAKTFVANMILLNSGNIINEVRRRWMLGNSVDGGIIGTYASSEYKAFKIAMNPQAKGNVDLHLTGSLAENLTVKKAGDVLFEIYSTDSKFQSIGKKYGFEEFGLSDEQTTELFNEIYDFALQSMFEKLW